MKVVATTEKGLEIEGNIHQVVKQLENEGFTIPKNLQTTIEKKGFWSSEKQGIVIS